MADARAVVQRHGTAVRAGAGEQYQPRSVLVDPDGARHVRFDRTHRGLPVLGGDYVVHANPDGSFRNATVAQQVPIAVPTRPAVNAARATAVALREFAARHRTVRPRLVVDAAAGKPVLAWQVAVQGADGADRHRTVIVDATSGAVRRSVNDVKSADDGTGHGLHSGEVKVGTTRRADGAFELVDPARGGGQTRDGLDARAPQPEGSQAFIDADNVWGNGQQSDRATAAVDVHYGIARAWDYFKQVHGRNGIRDDGKGAIALVHMAGRNAGWYPNCFCMKFGDGDGTTQPWTPLDVVAHEMAHGVTDATADLFYFGEYGALSEATSDIFGTLAEFHTGNPADPPDYLIGEHLDIGRDGGPLRYMDDPAKDGKSASCWYPEVGDDDVHYSSGVANKFFYTLAVGSGRSAWGDSPTCAGAPPVTGIGNDKAGRIWYRALTTYMVSTTDYAEARQATLFAARDLFGGRGPEYAAVDAAWKAVNVGGSDPLPEAPVVEEPADQDSKVGDPVRLQIQAKDPHGDPLTYAATGLPAGLSIDDSGLISGTPTTEGAYRVEVTVTDSHGHSGFVAFYWDVIGPPVVRNPGDQTHEEGEAVEFDIDATDYRYPLSYTATDLPEGVVIDREFGWVRGRAAQSGTWRSSVTVTDATGLSTTVSFTWTVRPMRPPGVPTQFTADRFGEFAALKWQPPAAVPHEIDEYQITGVPDGPVTVPGFTRFHLVTGLDPDRSYEVSVRAVNRAGAGAPATLTLPADPAPEPGRSASGRSSPGGSPPGGSPPGGSAPGRPGN